MAKALIALLKHTTMLEGLIFVTHKANILSFNEVKARGASSPRTVSSRRPSHASNFQIQPNNTRSTRTQSSRAVDALRASHASRTSSSSYSSGAFSNNGLSGSGLHNASNGSNGSKSAFGHNWDAATSFADQEVREPSWLKSSFRRGSGRTQERGSSRSNSVFNGQDFSAKQGYRSDGARLGGYRSNGLRSEGNYSGGYHAEGNHSDNSRLDGHRSDRGRSGARATHAGLHRADNRRNFADFEDDFAQDFAQEDVKQNSSHKHAHSHEKESFAQRMRKKFRSAKAERDFNRTIGARDRKAQTDAANASASRAALYEMRMGSTHRKSARMQDEGKDRPKFGFGLPFSLPVTSLSAAATRGIVALAVVGLTVFMLYPSCQNFYTETRQLQQLQAEYQALSDYNTQMQSQIDYLNTDEGLEEYARSELGWIRQDERMATVEGVESSVDGSTQTNTTYSPLNEDIPAPATWYSGVLDVLFGYGN